MPVTSYVLSMYLSELQTIGLLGSFYVGPPKLEKFLNIVRDRVGIFIAVFTAAENSLGEKLHLTSTPILYNSKGWSFPKILGGYAGVQATVKASELAISYIASWNFRGSYSRLVKATLWYANLKGDFMEGLNFLFDLFEAGYIVDQQEFVTAGLVLTELYSKVSDPLTVISKLPLDLDPSTTNVILKRLAKTTAKRRNNEQKIREIYTRILKRILDEIQNAREATSIGEYILSGAKITCYYRLLTIITSSYKPILKLSLAVQAIVSQIEEINADFISGKLTFLSTPKYFPLVQDTLGNMFSNQSLLAIAVGMGYHQEYGDEAAEKFFEDRLLVPNYLKAAFRQIFDKSQPRDKNASLEIPDEWNYYPLTFSFTLGAIKNIEPSLMRSKLFAENVILDEISNSYADYGLSNREIQDIVSEQYSQLSGSSDDETKTLSEPGRKLNSKRMVKLDIKARFYEIYRTLCARELETRFFPLILASDQIKGRNKIMDRRSQLYELSKIYPWLAGIYHEICIDSDHLKEENETLKNIKDSLLLDPSQDLAWKSMEVVCSRYSTQYDALFAKFMNILMHDRASNQTSLSEEYTSEQGAG